ncbi:MAG: ferrous iron transport protein A [Hungatella sp.]|jgi:ferrous iron transport protein A|nr:ferrous iron transport protein A [Hungatella sp.]MCI9637929.1 ferrous iron transport protein A [Hungatella sp.]
MVIPLSQIDLGETVKVVWVASEKHMADRLADLGFIPDEEISCVLKGRKGGMRAYLVRNAVIGLREENIGEIFVRTSPSL